MNEIKSLLLKIYRNLHFLDSVYFDFQKCIFKEDEYDFSLFCKPEKDYIRNINQEFYQILLQEKIILDILLSESMDFTAIKFCTSKLMEILIHLLLVLNVHSPVNFCVFDFSETKEIMQQTFEFCNEIDKIT